MEYLTSFSTSFRYIATRSPILHIYILIKPHLHAHTSPLSLMPGQPTNIYIYSIPEPRPTHDRAADLGAAALLPRERPFRRCALPLLPLCHVLLFSW